MQKGAEGSTEHPRRPASQAQGQSREQNSPRLAQLLWGPPGGPHRRWGSSGSWGHSPDQTKSERSTFSTGAVGQALTHCTICHEARETRCRGVGGGEGPQRQTPKWPTVVRGYNSSPTDSKGNACLPAGHAASMSPEQGGGPGGAAPRTGSHQGSLGTRSLPVGSHRARAT